MSPGLVTEPGTTDWCRPSSTSAYGHPVKAVLPPFHSPSATFSAAKSWSSIPPDAREGWSKDPPGRDQTNSISRGYRNDFDASHQAKRPRLSSSSFHFGSLPTTLPPPSLTLPPPYSMPQPLSMPPTLPPLPFPPPLAQPTEDLRRASTSQSMTGRPLTANSNRSQSPIGGRSLLPPSRRDSGQEPYSSRPPTSHSRRSSQASNQFIVPEDRRNSASITPTSVKQEPPCKPPAPPAKPAAAAVPTKSRRVRTGCLTCRERHLKCDESLPDCLNCRKGNRECKRGLRLNFIDIQVKPIPYVPPISHWKLSFFDESRAIASEYVGGSSRYPRVIQLSTEPPRDIGEINVKPPTRKSGKAPGEVSRKSQENGSSKTAFSHISVAQQSQLNLERDTTSTALQSGLPQAGEVLGLSSIKEEAGSAARSHSYRPSDASSVTSSMVPQGMGPPSTASFRAEMGNSPSASGLGNLELQGGKDMFGIPGDGRPDGLPTPPSEKAALVKGNALEAGICMAGVFEASNATAKTGEKEYLNSPDEVRFMQTFIDDVAVWMDSLNKDKHFSRSIPFLALKSPMLLNASLACGVKHLTLVGQSHGDDKALFYYDTATTQLLRSLQNPDRNIAECATAAVVLNVYEIMSEKPNERMSHIAGARALIRECGWDAKSEGVGAACFWLNIGMEVLSCLSFNWPTAWDPDQWGLNIDFAGDSEDAKDEEGIDSNAETKRRDSISMMMTDADPPASRDTKSPGTAQASASQSSPEAAVDDDEVWMHRIFYIVAKIANFRANIPRFQESSPHDEQVRLQNRFTEWKRLKSLCDIWNRDCPRSMRPFGYLFSGQNTLSNSLFPNVWLTKGAGVIGRLFYHTAMVLLHQVNPIEPHDSFENHSAQLHHAHQVCGIVSHNKDSGVVSVAIRSLAVAAQVLRDRCEQDEVLSLLDRISDQTCWRISKIYAELRLVWGRNGEKATPASAPSPPTGLGLGLSEFSANYSVGHALRIGSGGDQYREQQSNPNSKCAHCSDTPSEMMPRSAMALSHTASSTMSPPAIPAPFPCRPTQTANPLLHADFSLPDHPYKAFYKPPNETTPFNSRTF